MHLKLNDGIKASFWTNKHNFKQDFQKYFFSCSFKDTQINIQSDMIVEHKNLILPFQFDYSMEISQDKVQ